MSCPVTVSGPNIDTPPAYVVHRRDHDSIAWLFGSYKNAIFARPSQEIPVMPHTSAVLESFSAVERELRQLLKSEESDEFGPVRPLDNGVWFARKTLFHLVQAGFEVPPARDVGTDHDGALRVAWERGPKFLELVVPRENVAAPYLYYSQGDHYNLQRDLTSGAVCERFDWLSA